MYGAFCLYAKTLAKVYEPELSISIKLLLRRTLVRLVRKSASPIVRKKHTLNDSLSVLLTFGLC